MKKDAISSVVMFSSGIRSMKALIEIDFTIDGETPSYDKLKDAVFKMVSESGYIGSESVDGTDKWGLEIQEIKVLVSW